MSNSNMSGSGKAAEIVSFAGSSLIKGRWKVLKKIGAGAFGEIYSGKNVITNEMVAIKVERVDNKKQVLKLEVAVLKKLQSCPYVCRFVTCGRLNDYNYLIMELLGENLSELRRRQPDGKFSMATSLKLGIQMMKALEAVHDLGYIHRDVKPSNYAMGLSGLKRHTSFLIDFGLARRYLLTGGEIRPPRETTGFRGTARYASINSHMSKDLGRRDDLWSIFYMLIEFVQGQLPWRKLKDKDQIGEMKIKLNTPDLVKDLPPQFLAFMKHLKSLNYADRPDYNHLYSLLTDLYHSQGYDEHTPFDWEIGAPSRNPQYTATPHPSTQEVEFSGKAQTHLLAQSLNNNNHNDEGTPPLSPQVSLSSLPVHHHLHHNNNNSSNHLYYSPDGAPSTPQTTKLPLHNSNNNNNNNNANNNNDDDNSASHSAHNAASTSSDRQTGSWGGKPSPRASPSVSKFDSHDSKTSLQKSKGPPDKDLEGSGEGLGANLSTGDVGGEGGRHKPSSLRGSQKGSRDKEVSTCRCIIM